MKKIIVGFLCCFVFSLVGFGQQTTTVELTAQINALLAQVQLLQSQLGTLSAPLNLTRDLMVGSTGDDVTALQNALGVSPATGYFDSVTQAAVETLQSNHGIEPNSGYVGPVTRALLNSTSGRDITVAQINALLAQIQKLQALLNVPLTTVVSTANTIKQSSFTLRSSPSSWIGHGVNLNIKTDDAILIDTWPPPGGHTIIIKEWSSNTLSVLISVPEGEWYLVISNPSGGALVPGTYDPVSRFGGMEFVTTGRADNQSSGKFVIHELERQNGKLTSIALDFIQYDEGLAQWWNKGELRFNSSVPTSTGGTVSAYLSVFDPNGPATRKVGTARYRFSGIKVVVSSTEQGRLHSVVFTQNGTASAEDLSSVEVVIDGVSYSTKVSGKRYTATFGQGILIDKGFSKDVFIQGDLNQSAAGKTVKMDIANSEDVYLVGEIYGFGLSVYALGGGNAALGSQYFTGGMPWFSGSVLTVEPNPAPSVGGGGGGNPAFAGFGRDLLLGSTGEDVRMLQIILDQSFESFDTKIGEAGPSSPRLESSYFGPTTEAALKKWQAKYGFEVTGVTGPQTRAALNSLLPLITVVTGTVTGGSGSGGGGGGGGVTVVQTPTPFQPRIMFQQPTEFSFRVLKDQNGNDWAFIYVDERALSPKIQIQYSRNGVYWCAVPDEDLLLSPSLHALTFQVADADKISIIVYENR